MYDIMEPPKKKITLNKKKNKLGIKKTNRNRRENGHKNKRN